MDTQMARPLRIEFAGALYHVTSCGNERREIFFTDDDRASFLSVLADVVGRFNWRCHAYPLWALIFFMTRKPANFSCATPM